MNNNVCLYVCMYVCTMMSAAEHGLEVPGRKSSEVWCPSLLVCETMQEQSYLPSYRDIYESTHIPKPHMHSFFCAQMHKTCVFFRAEPYTRVLPAITHIYVSFAKHPNTHTHLSFAWAFPVHKHERFLYRRCHVSAHVHAAKRLFHVIARCCALGMKARGRLQRGPCNACQLCGNEGENNLYYISFKTMNHHR